MQARFIVQDFLRGARLSIPIIVASAPFGLLFGVVAVDNGFTIAEAVFMSAAVFAGASQMVGIELFGQEIAPWVVEGGIGAAFGRLLPDTHALGFDFMLPIYFLGLVMSFRKRPLWLPVVAASAAASMIAYKTVGSPWHVSIGAAAGILLAAFAAPANGNGAKKP